LFQPEEPIEENVSKVITLLNDVQPVKCVVVDMDFNLNYCKLTRAAMYLRDNPETLFITGATNQAILIESVVFLGKIKICFKQTNNVYIV
jgi:hypothetical protein